MMKGRITLFLLLVTVLLVGCGKSQPAPTDPAVVLHGTEPKDVYFATGNDFYDLYVGQSCMPGPEIVLLTRSKINASNIKITADLQASYQVYVTPQAINPSLTKYDIQEQNGVRELAIVGSGPCDLPLYIYQTYAGMDWEQIGKLYTDYQNTGNAESAFAAYKNAVTAFAEDYCALMPDVLPIFYAYRIQVYIDDVDVPEDFTTVHVSLNGETYDLEIGNIRIHPQEEVISDTDILTFAASSPWENTYPYGNGYKTCQAGTVYAEKSITLTGFSFRENTVSAPEITDLTLLLSGSLEEALEGTGMEIKWDGNTPIFVEQGQYVTLRLRIYDPAMAQVQYHSCLYPILQYTYDDMEAEAWVDCTITHSILSDPWLAYAIGLDGMDMESYFTGYYNLIRADR